MPNFSIDPDYKEVSERLRDLFAKHPEASLRGTYEFVDGHVIYRAECYRTPDDPAPAVGTAWEEVPGRTPYTKGSELQNAETSAWGRAIVAAGASESKRIASADEMRLANDRRTAPKPKKSSAVEAGEHPAAANGSESSSPHNETPSQPSSPNRVQQLQSKLSAMIADGVSGVAAERQRIGLPKLTDACSADELDLWSDLLNRIDPNMNRVAV